jgi:hypothetical protein
MYVYYKPQHCQEINTICTNHLIKTSAKTPNESFMFNPSTYVIDNEIVSFCPGANPTIVSYNASAVKVYNASAVKVYNATSSLVRFKVKNIFFYSEKRSSLLQRWRCICKFQISK